MVISSNYSRENLIKMKEKDAYSAVHYDNYLQLDKILDAQSPRSTELGKPAHDEMLFIVIHQVYELWFKEIIHNLSSIMVMFENDQVDEKNISIAVGRLKRIIEILKVLIDQITILETMTPLDFLDFRNYLLPASGFQSFQFRFVEVALGLKKPKRTTYGQKDYQEPFSKEQIKKLNDLENSNSMLQLLEKWLERIPFLEFGEFNFLEKYQASIENMLTNDREAVMKSKHIDEVQKTLRLRMLDESKKYYKNVFNEENHQKLVDEGVLKLSYKATFAALFINLYRDEPILQLPYQLLSSFVEIDELLTGWRYRHAQMILRMLGKKMGTGGSVGYDYLKKTADQHHIFLDLSNISTLMIPRSELPKLPTDFEKILGFHFTNINK